MDVRKVPTEKGDENGCSCRQVWVGGGSRKWRKFNLRVFCGVFFSPCAEIHHLQWGKDFNWREELL